MITRNLLQRPAALALFVLRACAVAFSVEAADTKPNIIIIWGDDIGQFNVCAQASDRDRSLVAVYEPARNNQTIKIPSPGEVYLFILIMEQTNA